MTEESVGTFLSYLMRVRMVIVVSSPSAIVNGHFQRGVFLQLSDGNCLFIAFFNGSSVSIDSTGFVVTGSYFKYCAVFPQFSGSIVFDLFPSPGKI